MKNSTYFVDVPSTTTWMLPGFLTRKFTQTGGASYCQVYCSQKKCNLWNGNPMPQVSEPTPLLSGGCPLRNSAN